MSKPWVLLALFLGGAGCTGAVDHQGSRGAAPRPTGDASEGVASSSGPRDIDLDEAAVVAPSPHEATAFYVWIRDPAGVPKTHRLDAAGRVLETLDGIYVATGAGAWQWREQVLAVPTTACERYDDEGHVSRGPDPDPGAATRVTLANVTTGAEQTIVDGVPDADGAESYVDGVELLGSVGPYLFVRRFTDIYACGAHGLAGASVTIWDASKGDVVGMPAAASFEQARASALLELNEGDDGFPATEESLAFTALMPRFAHDGALQTDLQFSSHTCYACSFGEGGSYTKSSVVPADHVVEPFASYAFAPDGVRAFLATKLGFTVGGWSEAGGHR